MELPKVEPFKFKMVEYLHASTREQREQWLKEEDYNLFNLASDRVFIDLLTDSGTGAMSDSQWAEMMLGDESYAGSSSYLKLRKSVKDITGYTYFVPTHQGRAAENILFSALLKEGHIVPGNTHFDTTKGHIEFRKAVAVDCTIDEAFDIQSEYDFKGNVDIKKLDEVYNTYGKERIPMVLLTITCNSCGGQPVSLQNTMEVRDWCEKKGIPLFFDGARFAENAYFIKERELGYSHMTIKEIVKLQLGCGVGMTMSSKKDGLVNMGGFVAINDEELYRELMKFGIIYEGFVTYGGMNGRDMGALAVGLNEATEYEYLRSRINQVEYLANKLLEYRIPIQRPTGGHAVYVDALSFYPNLKREEFPAQTLAVEIYKEGGVRGVEIGTILADRDPVTRENRYPKLELVRLAIPRRSYTYSHMDYVAATIKNVYDRRAEVQKGLEIKWEAPIMRHFTVRLQEKA